jgi:hypothetical protein
MERYVSELEQRLEAQLAETDNEKNSLVRTRLCVRLTRDAVDELKMRILSKPFSKIADEVTYFKELAPRIYSRLFYYMKIYKIESLRQYASHTRLKEYLTQEMAETDLFFTKYDEFCRYYYEQAYHSDDELFTRQGRDHWLADDINFIMDADFCLGSYRVSWIKANERYRVWLTKEIEGLDQPVSWVQNQKETRKLEWKGSRIELLEVIYGMHLMGSFGDVPIKQLAEWFEANLMVDLGNPYVGWQQIASRKKSGIKYVSLMEQRLVGKIEATP